MANSIDKNIEETLHGALELLRKKDRYLLEKDANERTITHKLAEYLQYYFQQYDVDCEYNLDIKDQHNRKNINDKKVYPDIVVHKRGKTEENLLVIEVKKSTNNGNEHDFEKLEEYTQQTEQNTLKYKYGVFIKIHVKENWSKEPGIIWFKDGRKL